MLGLGVLMQTEEAKMCRIYFGDPRKPGSIFVWGGEMGAGVERKRNLERKG